GSHTRFHPILPRCSDERAASEILDSKAEVEALTGRPCRHLAFPNGSYGERELRLARRAGYVSARSFDPGWNDSGTDRYRLRAFGVPDDSSVNRLAATLAGLAFAKRPRRADPGRIEHLRRGLRRHGLSGTALIAAAAARKRVFLREAHVWYRLPLGEPTELGLEGLELIRPGNSNPGLLAGLPGGGPLSARRRFEAQGEPWVACLGGEPAFLCWTYPVRAPSIASPDGWLPLPPGTVCVDDVVTVAAFRGRGIAPAALAKIASSLASAGAETLIAKVETQNHSSRRAFEKAGFRAAAEMRLVRVGPRTRVEVSGAPDPLALFLAGELAR
ncbi:MAG TPA: GNAT family N-acetyltransferase, partial [Gaiellaceae bacterium]